jgi:GR25 family glycosyltransferase involved in LPS biosynthesis
MNFKKFLNLDNIYVINLEKEKERKKLMQKKLKKYNIQVEFFKAINGKDPNIEKDFLQKKNKHIIPDDILKSGNLFRSSGAYACLLSHKKVIQDAINKNYDRICIFQDDIIFHKNFYNELNYKFSKINYHWDIIYLGNSKRNTSNFITGFFAVILKKNIFDDLLNLFNTEMYPADICLSKISNNNKYKKIVFKPSLIIVDTSFTTTFDNKIITKYNFYEKHFLPKNWNLDLYDLEYISKKSFLNTLKNNNKLNKCTEIRYKCKEFILIFGKYILLKIGLFDFVKVLLYE